MSWKEEIQLLALTDRLPQAFWGRGAWGSRTGSSLLAQLSDRHLRGTSFLPVAAGPEAEGSRLEARHPAPQSLLVSRALAPGPPKAVPVCVLGPEELGFKGGMGVGMRPEPRAETGQVIPC